MTPTAARTLSNRLAPYQPEEALRIARAIKAPWFRCQALSHVARYWPNENYVKLLEEAVRTADLEEQVYNCVAVSAWPIRAYLERDSISSAAKLLAGRTLAAGTIENLGSRSEALFHLFQASRPFDIALWQPVFWALVNTAEPALSWRQRRNLKNAVAMVSSDHPFLANQVVEKLRDPKNLAAVTRYIDERVHLEPRSYF